MTGLTSRSRGLSTGCLRVLTVWQLVMRVPERLQKPVSGETAVSLAIVLTFVRRESPGPPAFHGENVTQGCEHQEAGVLRGRPEADYHSPL